jgi:hypothetical protein
MASPYTRCIGESTGCKIGIKDLNDGAQFSSRNANDSASGIQQGKAQTLFCMEIPETGYDTTSDYPESGSIYQAR